jgi:hypothetical protein
MLYFCPGEVLGGKKFPGPELDSGNNQPFFACGFLTRKRQEDEQRCESEADRPEQAFFLHLIS